MATVQTIINRAVRLLVQTNSGEAADTQESADALESLNAMLGVWRNDRLMCYAIQDQSITLSSGNSTRTIGPTGNLVTTRPVRIDTAYIVQSNESHDVRIINETEYASIGDKTSAASWPTRLYYQPSMSNGTIYLWPVPNASSTLHVLTWTPVTEFATVSDAITLPPGWEDALASNLAVHLAPEYSVEPSQTLLGMARNSLAALRKINSRAFKAYTELPALVGNYKSNIITGYP